MLRTTPYILATFEVLKMVFLIIHVLLGCNTIFLVCVCVCVRGSYLTLRYECGKTL